MAAVSGSAFCITGEWATVDLMRDDIFGLLCLEPTAPACHSVLL